MSSIDPTSVRAIAKKDVHDAVRSYLFLGLSVLFFSLLLTPAILLWYFAGELPGTAETTENLMMRVYTLTSLLLPLIGLVLGWKSIAGARESGTIKVLLGQPHSRRDVIVGTFLGRSMVLILSLALGFLLAGGGVALLLGGFDVLDYLGLFLNSVLFGMAYVSIAVAVSSLTDTTTVAGVAVLAIFVWFYLLWDTAVFAVSLLLTFGYLPESEWIAQFTLFYHELNPGSAYANVLSLTTSFGERPEAEVAALEAVFDGMPFYLEDWFALVILLFWIVVPVWVAAWRFDRIDL